MTSKDTKPYPPKLNPKKITLLTYKNLTPHKSHPINTSIPINFINPTPKTINYKFKPLLKKSNYYKPIFLNLNLNKNSSINSNNNTSIKSSNFKIKSSNSILSSRKKTLNYPKKHPLTLPPLLNSLFNNHLNLLFNIEILNK